MLGRGLVGSGEFCRSAAFFKRLSFKGHVVGLHCKEWANSDSVTQQISRLSQMGPLAQAKQFIADKLAGDYDEERIGQLIDDNINSNKFFTCSDVLLCISVLAAQHLVEAEQILRALAEDHDVLLFYLPLLLASQTNP